MTKHLTSRVGKVLSSQAEDTQPVGRSGGGETLRSGRLPAEERKNIILKAGRIVFARLGFHRAGMSDVASEAGCSEAIIYRHYASKYELLASVLDDIDEYTFAALDRHLDPSEGTPAERILGLARRPIRPEVVERVRLRSLAVAMADDERVRASLRRYADGVRDRIANVVAEGQQDGTIRQDLDPVHFGWVWLGLALTSGLLAPIEGEQGLAIMPNVSESLVRTLVDPVGTEECNE